jgi:16S rRNA (guanine966-N2)-methyltransferase
MSKLRINRGELRGRNIRFVETPDLRPTLGRVREAIFNIIEDFSETHGFLDLCAGSAIMAFEAISNGFTPVHALEIDQEAMVHIKRNENELGVKIQLHRAYAEKIHQIQLPAKSWVIFADPPYRERRFHTKVLERMSQMPAIEKESLYIAEQEQAWSGDIPEGWEPWKEKRYGRVHLIIFQRT